MVKYIICVVTNKSFSTAVGLTKLKGPEQLIKKITFPGGKIEKDESWAKAASREILEEANLAIPESSWTVIDHQSFPSYEITIVHAFSTPEFCRQMEEEPVYPLDLNFAINQAKIQPEVFVPDFLKIVEKVKQVLNLS